MIKVYDPVRRVFMVAAEERPSVLLPSFLSGEEPPSVPALYAFLLGCIFSGSLLIVIFRSQVLPNMPPFAAHLCALALFHFLEYFWQAKYHPKTTTSDGNYTIELMTCLSNFIPFYLFIVAFLLNHSKEYSLAIVMGFVEYAIKRMLHISPVFLVFQLIGSVLIIFGIILRSMAMIKASSNFSHVLHTNLSQDHKLVQDGVYSLFRHPSYLGFFAFAVGEQVILGNYISTVLFVFVLQKFFRERILVEEAILNKTYPKEYVEYKKKTWSGIPFHSD